MFSSSGLFADITCPLLKLGLCGRPYCLYKHANNEQATSGASCQPSIIDLPEAHYCYQSVCGVTSPDETEDGCLQELERLNKEIETVRHEVEQEQRRLSHYQTAEADVCVGKPEAAGKHVNRASYGLPSCTDCPKTDTRSTKYVVDNSKPRTDLEYDPMSNFSADFRSYKSSGKEQRVKNGQGLKRARSPDQSDGKSLQQLSRSSPEQLDDSCDEPILIIDITPSPDRKRGHVQKPADCLPNLPPGTVKEPKQTRQAPIVLDSPPIQPTVDTDATPADVANECHSARVAENTRPSSDPSQSKEPDIVMSGSVIDLTGCLGDLEHQRQEAAIEMQVLKSPVPASLPDPQGPSVNYLRMVQEENTLCSQLPQSDHPCGTEKTNLLQPQSGVCCPKFSADDYFPPYKCTKYDQRTVSEMTQQMQDETAASPGSNLEPSEPAAWLSAPGGANPVLTTAKPSSSATEQLMVEAENGEVIVINSGSDEEEQEGSYSELDLSDSDPMEECYRIFMEANEEPPDVSVETVDEKTPEVQPQMLPGKRRVAHEARQSEPVGKSRPQPQVLVPLRGPAAPAPQLSTTSKIQQVQQRVSVRTASVKGGQTFVAAACPRTADTTTAALLPTQLSTNEHQNAYMNLIPLGTTVLEVGKNLHLVFPQGSLPLSATSTSSLTPVSQGHVKQTCPQAAVLPVQRYRTTAPLLIPAQARKKPSFAAAAAAASVHSTVASLSTPHAVAKPAPTKRKVKQPFEAAKDKVPHDIRQRYVNMFTEEFLRTTANVNEAFEKALAEEKTVYNRSMNKLKYLSVAVNALKRLKKQNAAAKDKNEVKSQRTKGYIPLNQQRLTGNDDGTLYESLKDYILTEEKLVESNYPVQHPEKPTCAVLFADNKKSNTDTLRRICCRCGATYSVSQSGKHVRKEECNYHYGKGVEKKVPGGVETRYSCCQGVMGAPGCQQFKLHVHDSFSPDRFVATLPRAPLDSTCPGVYSVDCEVCYTIHGLELSRVTVVNSSLQIVYDTFVRPDSEVIDYNTRFSGISEDEVKVTHTSLTEVQDTLLSFISSDTILIGHGLEKNLCALKLLHGTVVDTSVVFPHRLGPPHKLSLNSLTAEYLRRIIQESVCGHDTAEDAAACMELMLWKVKDGKVKK